MRNPLVILIMINLAYVLPVFANSGFTLPPEFNANPNMVNQNNHSTNKPPPKPANKSFKLTITPTKKSYKLGDLMSLSVKTNQSCYLSLIDFGTSGAANLLFPNAYQVDNYLEANKPLTLPNSQFDIQIGGAIGKEKILGICTLKDTPLFNTNYNFKRQIFISLGKASSISGLSDISSDYDKTQQTRNEVIITITR